MHLKFGATLSDTYKDKTLYPHMYQNVHCNLLQSLKLGEYSEYFFMFGAILKATNSSFQKGMTFCRSIM